MLDLELYRQTRKDRHDQKSSVALEAIEMEIFKS